MVSSIGSGGFGASALLPNRKDIFSRADANGDGKLDATEIDSDLAANAPKGGPDGVSGKAPTAAEIVAKLDTDGDGSVSAAEFEAAPPPPKGGKFAPETASTLLSAQEEASQALLKLFEKADANSDGDVTEDEFTSFIRQAVEDEDFSGDFAAAVSALFKSQDTNGDGVVNALDTTTDTEDAALAEVA